MVAVLWGSSQTERMQKMINDYVSIVLLIFKLNNSLKFNWTENIS